MVYIKGERKKAIAIANCFLFLIIIHFTNIIFTVFSEISWWEALSVENDGTDISTTENSGWRKQNVVNEVIYWTIKIKKWMFAFGEKYSCKQEMNNLFLKITANQCIL